MIDASLLASAIKRANAVITGSSYHLLHNVRLESTDGSLRISATNMDSEYCETLPFAEAEWSCLVDARRFKDIVGTLSGPVYIDHTYNTLSVKSGLNAWELPSLPDADWPKIPFEADLSLKISGADLSDALLRAAPAVSNNQFEYYLGGVYLHSLDEKLGFAATDKHKLICLSLDVTFPAAPSIIIPTKLAVTLARLCADHDEMVLSWSDKILRAVFGDCVLTGKLIDGSFPDYRRVVPEKSSAAVFDRAEMIAAIRGALLVQDHKERAVTFQRRPDFIEISAYSQRSGRSTQVVKAECDNEVISTFNGANLCTVLESLGGDTVELHQSEAMAPARISRIIDDGCVVLIDTIRQ